jgi:branched-chain amino acid transport system permease protein
MTLRWTEAAYSLALPSSDWQLQIAGAHVNGTQVIALALGVTVTASAMLFLRHTALGTAMRALADDREITAMLGVPVRRVETVAWAVSGALAGVTGLLLSNLVGLDAATLTFLVVPVLAAAVVGRLGSLPGTLAGALLIGLVQSCLTPVDAVTEYRATTPFVVAMVAMLWFSRRRPAMTRV